MTAFEALQKKYEWEASLNNMREHLEELESAIPELKARQREAQVAVAEASGGFQRFWKRLSGKETDEEQAALDRAARAAAAELERAQRERKSLKDQIAAAEAEWEALGQKQELMDQLAPEERDHFLRLEASICAEGALHYLRECRKELEQAQYYARNPMMAVNDGYRENTHKANAGALADQCREKLERIHSCGFDFEIHPYIRNPMGYIVTAMRYGDQDQMNKAQKGIRDTEKALKELLLQLTE